MPDFPDMLLHVFGIDHLPPLNIGIDGSENGANFSACNKAKA
jgi:hypothetical protein